MDPAIPAIAVTLSIGDTPAYDPSGSPDTILSLLQVHFFKISVSLTRMSRQLSDVECATHYYK